MNTTIIICAIISTIAIAGIIIYAHKHYQLHKSIIFLGIAGFFVGSQIIEKIVLMLTLRPSKTGDIALMHTHPWAYIVYGAFAAAFFEETTRLILLRPVAKKRQLTINDGISYGIGHGGIEFILLRLSTLIITLIAYQTIQQGKSTLPSSIIKIVTAQTTSSVIVSMIETILAFITQILLSYLVFQAIKTRKYSYYGYAMCFHFLMDTPVGMYQTGIMTNIYAYIIILTIVTLLTYATARIIYNKNSQIESQLSNKPL